jgi:hypothetical protein
MPVCGLRRCAPEIGLRLRLFRFRGKYLLTRRVIRHTARSVSDNATQPERVDGTRRGKRASSDFPLRSTGRLRRRSHSGTPIGGDAIVRGAARNSTDATCRPHWRLVAKPADYERRDRRSTKTPQTLSRTSPCKLRWEHARSQGVSLRASASVLPRRESEARRDTRRRCGRIVLGLPEPQQAPPSGADTYPDSDVDDADDCTDAPPHAERHVPAAKEDRRGPGAIVRQA